MTDWQTNIQTTNATENTTSFANEVIIHSLCIQDLKLYIYIWSFDTQEPSIEQKKNSYPVY